MVPYDLETVYFIASLTHLIFMPQTSLQALHLLPHMPHLHPNRTGMIWFDISPMRLCVCIGMCVWEGKEEERN